LPAKNTLTTDHAQSVEAAFQVKLTSLGDFGDLPGDAQMPGEGQPDYSEPAAEKTSVALQEVSGAGHGRVAAKTIRLRDKDHRKFVSRQPCVVCGRTPVDPHHLRFAQPRALSRKVSDEFLVTCVSSPSPRVTPARRRGRVLEGNQYRSDASRTEALASDGSLTKPLPDFFQRA
jgi:hypothetical protein